MIGVVIFLKLFEGAFVLPSYLAGGAPKYIDRVLAFHILVIAVKLCHSLDLDVLSQCMNSKLSVNQRPVLGCRSLDSFRNWNECRNCLEGAPLC